MKRVCSIGLAALLSVAACESSKPPTEAAPEAAADEKEPTEVTMTPEAVKAAGLTTTRAKDGEIVAHDDLPGEIQAPPNAQVVVNSRTSGVIETLAIDVGDRVTAGQPIATIRSLELAEAQAAYRRSLLDVQAAGRVLERSRGLFSDGVIAKRRVEADEYDAQAKALGVEEAKRRVELLGGTLSASDGMTTVLAPIDGVVSHRVVSRGEAVAVNSPLATVVDVRQVLVALRAPPGTAVAPGTTIQVKVAGLGERTFEAKVKTISDMVDPTTRRFVLRCSVDNADGALKPGMFVTGALPRPAVRAVTVPEAAVQIMASGPAVFVVKPAQRFERRDVVLGVAADGNVAITKGVTAGEEVVVEGAFWVRTQLEKSTLEE